MLVKNEYSEEIEIISVYGRYEDDIQIDEISYVNRDDEVSNSDIEYIENNYSGEIYEMWYEQQIGTAESLWEGMER